MKKLLTLFLVLTSITSAGLSVNAAEIPLDTIKALAQERNANAVHTLCFRYSYGYGGATKDHEQAYFWCNKSVQEYNNNSSITLLAELYYLGNYVEQNYQVAFSFYEKAALLGHSHAQKVLYVMYSEGQGVEQSDTLAEYWINKSATGGDAQAKRIVKQLSQQQASQ